MVGIRGPTLGACALHPNKHLQNLFSKTQCDAGGSGPRVLIITVISLDEALEAFDVSGSQLS